MPRRSTLALLTATAAASLAATSPMPIHVDVAAGRLAGATTRGTTHPAGQVGPVYVTGFRGGKEADKDVVTLTVPAAAAGLYDVTIRYAAATGPKGFQLRVNGLATDAMFPQTFGPAFATYAAGRVELNRGDNVVAIGGGWGNYDLAAIDLAPAVTRPPAEPSVVPCDPQATPAARAAFRRLVDGYGRVTLAGGYGGAEDGYVAAHANGRRPAVYGADLMDFSPSRVARGTDPSGIVPDLLRHAADGQLLTLSWHWNAPAHLVDRMVATKAGEKLDRRWYKGFNADATTFDVAAALADPHSPDHQLLVRDIDAIAVPLKRLADAGVPVLWRPLHEAEGAWFWWGAKGPRPFVALWRLMYDRLTHDHHLHNLIWVYSHTTLADPAWYPGDACADVVGLDAYPADLRDAQSAIWTADTATFARRKLLALSEFGGVPDVGRMHRLGCPWAYFVSWTGPQGPAKNGPAGLRAVYDDPYLMDLAKFTAGR